MEKKYLKYKFKYNHLKKKMLGGGNEEKLIKEMEFDYLNKIKDMIHTRLEELAAIRQSEDFAGEEQRQYVFNSIEYGNSDTTFYVQEFDDNLVITVIAENTEPEYYSSLKDQMYMDNIKYLILEDLSTNTSLNKLFAAIPENKISELQSLRNFLVKYKNNICFNKLLEQKLITIIANSSERKMLSECIFNSYMQMQQPHNNCDNSRIKMINAHVNLLENGKIKSETFASTISNNSENVTEHTKEQFDKNKEIIINMFTIYNIQNNDEVLLDMKITKVIDITRIKYTKLHP